MITLKKHEMNNLFKRCSINF